MIIPYLIAHFGKEFYRAKTVIQKKTMVIISFQEVKIAFLKPHKLNFLG
jgi:hypothetical protein